MNIDDLKTYFEENVKQYYPYKDDKIHTKLVDFLTNKYYTNAYEITPKNLRDLFEKQELIIEIYDFVLAQLGLPIDVINDMNFSEKEVFLKSMNDFMRYKGSIEFFKRLSNSYEDEFDLYELYASYNEGEAKWVLKPYNIVSKTRFAKTDFILDYDEVYNKIPSLLVSSQQLTELYNHNNIVTPYKTNLLMLDYNMIYNINALTPLIISTIIKEKGTDSITLYFDDNDFTIELKEIYFIWYYILSFYYNTTWTKFEPQSLLFYSEYLNPYSFEDISFIQSELNKIKYSNDVYEIYEKYLNIYFNVMYNSDTVEHEDMRNFVLGLNPTFLAYFEETISGLDEAEKMRKINEIIERIYDSLILFYRGIQEPLYKKYFDVFLLSLPHIILNPEDTISYLLMYNLKPYHVELVTRHQNSIVCDDQFNRVTPRDKYNFLIEILKADFLSKLDDEYFNSFEMERYISLIISSSSKKFDFQLKNIYEEFVNNFRDNIIQLFQIFLVNVEEIFFSFLHEFNLTREHYYNINNSFKFNMELVKQNDTISKILNDLISIILTFEKTTTHDISSEYKIQLFISLLHDLGMNDEIVKIQSMFKTLNFDYDDQNVFVYLVSLVSVLVFIHNYIVEQSLNYQVSIDYIDNNAIESTQAVNNDVNIFDMFEIQI